MWRPMWRPVVCVSCKAAAAVAESAEMYSPHVQDVCGLQLVSRWLFASWYVFGGHGEHARFEVVVAAWDTNEPMLHVEMKLHCLSVPDAAARDSYCTLELHSRVELQIRSELFVSSTTSTPLDGQAASTPPGDTLDTDKNSRTSPNFKVLVSYCVWTELNWALWAPPVMSSLS